MGSTSGKSAGEATKQKVAKKAAAKSKPAATKSAGSSPASAASGRKRYFEFVSGKSNKFWEISVDGVEITVRYGRIGANGTSKVNGFADEAAAAAHAEKLVDEKTGKGYVEQ